MRIGIQNNEPLLTYESEKSSDDNFDNTKDLP